MPLAPQVARLLHMLSASREGERRQSAEDRRRDLDNLAAAMGGDAPQMAEVENLQASASEGPIPLRRYRPTESCAGTIVFLHGGGWVAGSLETHDGLCRRLAEASGMQVFAVDYRLAPEHPFPAGLVDALAAIRWSSQQASALGADPGPLIVAGDSAGGNLAAAACLMMRDQGGPAVARLLLICPILDLAEDSPSRRAFKDGYFLNEATMLRDLADYAPSGADLYDARLSPLHAVDLADLPPVDVHVAEFDPFRDEGLAAEGFDPAKIADALYFDDAAMGAYRPLDAVLYAKIAAGEIRL